MAQPAQHQGPPGHKGNTPHGSSTIRQYINSANAGKHADILSYLLMTAAVSLLVHAILDGAQDTLQYMLALALATTAMAAAPTLKLLRSSTTPRHLWNRNPRPDIAITLVALATWALVPLYLPAMGASMILSGTAVALLIVQMNRDRPSRATVPVDTNT